MDARRRLLSGGLTLGKLAIGAYTAPTYFVLAESGADKDYIVIKHKYPAESGGGTLLLRKDAFYFGTYDDDNENAYEDCTMSFLLSSNLPGKFSTAIQNALITASIPMGGSTTLARKVFVLSGTELGLSSADMTVAGSAIPYFSGNSARATGSYYWTRSADTSGSTKAFQVNTTGALNSANTNTNANGHPCLVLPGTTRVQYVSGKYYPV